MGEGLDTKKWKMQAKLLPRQRIPVAKSATRYVLLLPGPEGPDGKFGKDKPLKTIQNIAFQLPRTLGFGDHFAIIGPQAKCYEKTIQIHVFSEQGDGIINIGVKTPAAKRGKRAGHSKTRTRARARQGPAGGARRLADTFDRVMRR